MGEHLHGFWPGFFAWWRGHRPARYDNDAAFGAWCACMSALILALLVLIVIVKVANA